MLWENVRGNIRLRSVPSPIVHIRTPLNIRVRKVTLIGVPRGTSVISLTNVAHHRQAHHRQGLAFSLCWVGCFWWSGFFTAFSGGGWMRTRRRMSRWEIRMKRDEVMIKWKDRIRHF